MPYLRSFAPPAQAGALRVSEGQLPIADYALRDGYRPDFLGGDPLPLPGPGRWADDLVPLKPAALLAGADPAELRYRHFSVKMARSRGLPLFSACNIDGRLSDREIERTDIWRRDSRIEAGVQNLREAYGHEHRGLFSRGHMTRREDPNWGDRETAEEADADTFHITNAAPQRQGFNGGIWLDLENYVLDSTDRNDMKVTVLTGPVLAADDPVYFNIKVPVTFWKIIAFFHAGSGRLTTIAYKRSQFTFLPSPSRPRFVFGDFQDTQVSVASIALDTGLDLDAYAALDVFDGAGPEIEVRLAAPSDAYLVR